MPRRLSFLLVLSACSSQSEEPAPASLNAQITRSRTQAIISEVVDNSLESADALMNAGFWDAAGNAMSAFDAAFASVSSLLPAFSSDSSGPDERPVEPPTECPPDDPNCAPPSTECPPDDLACRPVDPPVDSGQPPEEPPTAGEELSTWLLDRVLRDDNIESVVNLSAR